jgi:hypothetical protein
VLMYDESRVASGNLESPQNKYKLEYSDIIDILFGSLTILYTNLLKVRCHMQDLDTRPPLVQNQRMKFIGLLARDVNEKRIRTLQVS